MFFRGNTKVVKQGTKYLSFESQTVSWRKWKKLKIGGSILAQTGFFLGGMVPYRDLNPRVTVRSLFFETAETLTFYLDIILFENVPAQIANGVFLLIAAAS